MINSQDVYEKRLLEEIMSVSSQMRVKDPNQAIIAESLLEYYERIGLEYDIVWCTEKYVRNLKKSLRRFKRFDKQLLWKLRRRYHSLSDLRSIADIFWGLEIIPSEKLSRVLTGLLYILRRALGRIRKMEETVLEHDIEWLAFAVKELEKATGEFIY